MTKNRRFTYDLYVEENLEMTISVLLAAGGATLGNRQTGSAGGLWQIMTDPAGNEFCVCQLS